MPTLGNYSASSPPSGYSVGHNGSNDIFCAGPFTATESGTITSISAYFGTNVSGTTWAVAVYAQATGMYGSEDQPEALLGASGSYSMSANAWNTISGLSIPIVAGQTYWLGFLLNGGSGTNGRCYKQTDSPAGCDWIPAGGYPAFDNPAPQFPTVDGQDWAVYATFTPAPSGGLPLPLFQGAA